MSKKQGGNGMRVRLGRRTLALATGGLFSLSTVNALAQDAPAHNVEATFLINGESAAANDGWVCTIRGDIGSSYPNDAVYCFDQNLKQVMPQYHMNDLDLVGVGDSGRVWGMRDRQVLVSVNDKAELFGSIPTTLTLAGAAVSLGTPKQFILASTDTLTTWVLPSGATLAMTDIPVVLTSSGVLLRFFKGATSNVTDGRWDWLDGTSARPVVALASYWRDGHVYPHYMFEKGPNQVNAPYWDQINLVAGSRGPGYFFGDAPVPFKSGSRWAFGGRSMIVKHPKWSYNWWENWAIPQAPLLRNWQPVVCADEKCFVPGVLSEPQPAQAFLCSPELTCGQRPFDIFYGVSEDDTFKEGWGGSIVGGGHGIWGAPTGTNVNGGRVRGFFTNNTGRVNMLFGANFLDTIEGEGPSELPDPELKQLLAIWDAEGQLDPTHPAGPDVVGLDELGNPEYQTSAGWNEIPAQPLATSYLPLFGDNVEMDVFVPASTSWAGTVSMHGAVPAAGVWDTYLGQVELSGLPRGVWSKATFVLPAAVKQALNGDFPNAELRTFVSSGIDGIRLKGVRTTPAPDGTSRPTHQPRRAAVATSSLLSFENPADWAGNQIEANTSIVSDGNYALMANSTGWTEILSRPFSTSELPTLTSKLSLDIFVPNPRPNPYWVGNVNVYLSCPSRGVWGQYIGQSDLTYLFPGEFNTVVMPVPQSLRTALSSSAQDCSFRITLNTAATGAGVGSFIIDRMGFVP